MTTASSPAPVQDKCPACGYADAMLCQSMHPVTGLVSWLRCHRCGTDREAP